MGTADRVATLEGSSMTLRKYAHGEISDVSGTEDTVADLNQAEDNDIETNEPDNDDYDQSN
jgi:hypothetical protein